MEKRHPSQKRVRCSSSYQAFVRSQEDRHAGIDFADSEGHKHDDEDLKLW